MDLKLYLSQLEQLVNIDSCSDDPEGLNTVAAFFANGFREMGWIVEEYDFAPHCGTCVICTNRKAERYDVLMIGHMDTVFPKGACAQRPYRTEGNRAYGPGVADMKQGCLLMYYLMRELPKEVNEKLNICVVFNPDEEIGSRYSWPAYEPYAKKADYAFVYEARSSKGGVCIERKGAVQYKLKFTGVPAHCGFVFKNGAKSAVSEMARWIVTLDGLQSVERNTSVNVGVVSGGSKPNVVPANANMTVDIRFSDPAEADRVEQTVAELLKQAEEHGIGVEITERRCKLPLVPSEKGKAYLAHIEALCKEKRIPILFEDRGGLSDANLIAQHGAVCIDGMGPAGGDGHSPDEYMLLDTIIPAYDLSMLLFKDLAEHK